MKILGLVLLAFGINSLFAAEHPAVNQETNLIQMQSVRVNGSYMTLSPRETVLGSFPEDIYFYFGINTNFSPAPVRIRYKLEGYDNGWQDDDVGLNGEMNLTVRFFNNKEDLIGEKMYTVSGESAGWTGSLKTSSLTHRREALVVPPETSKLMVVISSAGAPATTGIYAVANLVVSESSNSSPSMVLLQFPFDHQSYGSDEVTNQTPYGWMRDGTRPSMAKIVQLGEESDTEALAIVDDSLVSHAEWHIDIAQAPKVVPGDHLIVEWNEMYSIGIGDTRVAIYKKLPTGRFRFRVEAVNVMGNPTGSELSLPVRVPPPFWRTFWFWGIVGITGLAVAIATGRYIILRRMRQELAQLEKQRILEHERARIARDIHDDLGARVTQISLVSAMTRSKIDLEQARMAFDQISEMSRDLVAALYETVWAVNPDNDNLNELGNYLFQMVNKFCEKSHCRCRFYVDLLPREIMVPSQMRHNICIAVKEAVHNVVKHANASEIVVRIEFADCVLTISIQDDGCGFQLADSSAGNGLSNLKRRMQSIGGSCVVESQPGRGTTVQMRLQIARQG